MHPKLKYHPQSFSMNTIQISVKFTKTNLTAVKKLIYEAPQYQILEYEVPIDKLIHIQ